MMIDQIKTDPKQPRILFRAGMISLFAVALSLRAATCFSQDPRQEAPASEVKSAAASAPAEGERKSQDPHEEQSDKIQYVGPDTYILLDSAGRPQVMPGMTYEDFLAAWKKLNQPQKPDAQPRYSIEDLAFDGRVVGQRADLQCTATVQLLNEGATDVPLGLVGAILQGVPHFESVSSNGNNKTAAANENSAATDLERLSYDPEHGGFLARFVGHAGDKRKLTLGLIVPLLHEGAETTLPLNCPRALSSQLTIKIDSEVSEARTNTGTIVSQDQKGGEAAGLKVAGPAGIFRLTWQNAAKNTSAMASILNALSAIHVTVDGRGIRSDARLTVRSFGGMFDQFRVRLPPGAQLIQTRPDSTRSTEAQYRISVESEAADPAKDGASQQVVLVEFPEKQKGPVVVDLATEQSGGVDKPDQEINLSGFEVVGAVRQFGDVSLTISDDWQARWQAGPFVRQIDPSELDASLQSTGPTAAFQFDRQPWSLKVHVAPRRMRAHVTPKFELECQAEEVRLVAHLAYQFFGARAFEVRVDLKGWEMTGDAVEAGGMVDQDRMTVTPQGTLILPLTRAASRRVDVTLPLRRSIGRDASRLELTLPVPSADSVGTGDLIVRAAANLEVLPDLSKSIGLAAPPDTQQLLAAPESGATELHFRTLLPCVTLAADCTRRAGETTSQTFAQVQLSQDSAEIEERISYLVRFEPLSELAFEIPAELAPEARGLDVELLPAGDPSDAHVEETSTPLHVNPFNDGSTSDPTGVKQIRVMLPRPQIGKFTVRLRYHTALQHVAVADTEWSIPLVRSTDGESKSQAATVFAPRNISLSLDDTDEDALWKEELKTSESQQSTYSFRADGSAVSLPLVARQGRSDLPASTIVERVWLQTWLANGIQQDRAAFRLRTTANQATVELPPDLTANEIETLVDRKPAEVLSQAHGRLVVRLPASSANGSNDNSNSAPVHTLELRSRQPVPSGLLQSHRFTPSQIEGSTALSQVYWQIVVPGDVHVIRQPAQLLPAGAWQWLGSFWGRGPLKTQSELEEWIGASRQVAPTDSESQYLYTGLLPISSIEIAVAPRWLIVLVASSAVLLVTLALLYMPRSQRRWLLAATVCLLLLGSIVYPEAALLLGQAAVLGLLLSGMSMLLRRSVRRPGLPLSPAMTSASSRQAVTPRAESILMPPPTSNASTAPTATLRMAESKQ